MGLCDPFFKKMAQPLAPDPLRPQPQEEEGLHCPSPLGPLPGFNTPSCWPSMISLHHTPLCLCVLVPDT